MRGADRVKRMPYSTIRLMYEKAPPDSINLALGDSYVPLSDSVKKKMTEFKEREFHYTPNLGFPELRIKIAEEHESFDQDNVIVTAGGIQAIYEGLLAHVNPGEKVLFPVPGFEPYPRLINLVGGVPLPYHLMKEKDYELPVKDISSKLDDVSAIILNSPHNPTGAVHSGSSLEKLAEQLYKHKVFAISDEVYDKIVYQPEEHHSVSEFTDNVLVVGSISKPYGLTGLRLGWGISNKETIGNMLRVHQNIQGCAPAISQEIALAALEEPVNKEYYQERRDLVLKELDKQKIPYFTPGGANYVYIDASKWSSDSVSIAQDLMSDTGVILTPGKAFGDNDPMLRLCYTIGTETQLTEAIERISTVLN